MPVIILDFHATINYNMVSYISRPFSFLEILAMILKGGSW